MQYVLGKFVLDRVQKILFSKKKKFAKRSCTAKFIRVKSNIYIRINTFVY